MPGVQTLLPLMLDHVNAGRLSLQRLVDLTSASPQRIYGIAGKGRLAVGYDGDLTLVDLAARREITADWLAAKCGWSPFEGMTVTSWPMATVVRGHMVMRDGALQGEPGGRCASSRSWARRTNVPIPKFDHSNLGIGTPGEFTRLDCKFERGHHRDIVPRCNLGKSSMP